MQQRILLFFIMLVPVGIFFACTALPAVKGQGKAAPESPVPERSHPQESVLERPATPERAAEPPAQPEPQRTEPLAPPEPQRTETPEKPAIPGSPALSPRPETPEIPPVPEYIMGKGITAPDQMVSFFLHINPEVTPPFVTELAAIYIEEAAIEGVNHDIAFAQMCLETGFLRYGNLVTPDMNNFCGLGAIGPEQPGLSFPNPRTGVRAQIQHLKGYATDAPLKQELVDPRYRWIRYGSAPEIRGLAGTWAADREYAHKIRNILERLYGFSFGKDITPP
ncbi:MAG: glucosaminidase domain-containing protein [Treponema sp.]|nr:glucosaminidase domain-containing protein [Treponema sp.]